MHVRVEAQATRRLRRTGLRARSTPRSVGLDDLCPALRLTSKQDEKMRLTLNDVPRFESFDFGFDEKQLVPMRIGERISGSVRISFGKNMHKVHLGAGKPLNLRVKRFRAHESSCFQCPTCGKW